jgi:hypothetical protein
MSNAGRAKPTTQTCHRLFATGYGVAFDESNEFRETVSLKE